MKAPGWALEMQMETGGGSFAKGAPVVPLGVAAKPGPLVGIGNGMSAGTMLTLGTDLAPDDSPGQFLSALASVQNLGRILGPLIVGWFADAVGLRASAVALAVVMFVAITWIVVLIGETSEGHQGRFQRRSLDNRS